MQNLVAVRRAWSYCMGVESGKNWGTLGPCLFGMQSTRLTPYKHVPPQRVTITEFGPFTSNGTRIYGRFAVENGSSRPEFQAEGHRIWYPVSNA